MFNFPLVLLLVGIFFIGTNLGILLMCLMNIAKQCDTTG